MNIRQLCQYCEFDNFLRSINKNKVMSLNQVLKNANEKEYTLPNNKKIRIHTVKIELKKWQGSPLSGLPRTYLSKPLIDFHGKCFFPELAILNMLYEEGYDGIWIDSFHHRLWKEMPNVGSPVATLLLKIKTQLLNLLCEKDVTFVGAWDLLLWKGNETNLLFIELKGIPSRDKLRLSQLNFLQKAMACGFCIDQFIIVEWAYA